MASKKPPNTATPTVDHIAACLDLLERMLDGDEYAVVDEGQYPALRESIDAARTQHSATPTPEPVETSEAQAALDAVIATQTAFWDALSELESATGHNLNSHSDYESATLENITDGDYDEE